MKTQTAAHVKTRCFADFVIYSLTMSEQRFCLVYSHFLQDGNERAVTDLTGAEKHQEGVLDKNA